MKGLTLANAPSRCVLPACGVPLVQTRKGPPRKFCSEEHERLAYRERMKAKRAARKETPRISGLFSPTNPKRLTIKT